MGSGSPLPGSGVEVAQLSHRVSPLRARGGVSSGAQGGPASDLLAALLECSDTEAGDRGTHSVVSGGQRQGAEGICQQRRQGKKAVRLYDRGSSTPVHLSISQGEEHHSVADSAGLGAAPRHRGEGTVEPRTAHWRMAREHVAAGTRRPSAVSPAPTYSGPSRAVAPPQDVVQQVAPRGEHRRVQSAPPLTGHGGPGRAQGVEMGTG